MNILKKIPININNNKSENYAYIVDNNEIYVNLDLVKTLTNIESEVIDEKLFIKDISWKDIPLKQTVIIDAGHGGKDAGAVDEIDKENDDFIRTLEKDLNLLIAKKVATKLNSLGFNAILIRNDDNFVELYDRTKIANKTDAILFLSIHFNAATEKANGIETFKFKNSKNPISHKFAENLQSELIKATGFKDRGVKEASYWVLKHTKMAASLVELGFITNNKEEKILHTEEYQNKVSNALVNAVIITLKNIK